MSVCAWMAAALPALAQDGPTLEATLNFIRDKVIEQGPVAYTADYTDSSGAYQPWTQTFTHTATSIVANPAGCGLTYHWVVTREGKNIQEMDTTMPFSAIVDVQVLTRDQELAKADAQAGHPAWQRQLRTPVYAVEALRSDAQFWPLYFTDQSMADRVAKAVAHAAQLCGGLKPEAF